MASHSTSTAPAGAGKHADEQEIHEFLSGYRAVTADTHTHIQPGQVEEHNGGEGSGREGLSSRLADNDNSAHPVGPVREHRQSSHDVEEDAHLGSGHGSHDGRAGSGAGTDMERALENQAAEQAREARDAAAAAAVLAATSENPGLAYQLSEYDDGEFATEPARTARSEQGYPPTYHAPVYREQLDHVGGGGEGSGEGQQELSSTAQVAILREYYARNPNPSKKEFVMLAEKTGRPWNKIREYFRQRRNKLRGLDMLESMEEPGRATGWLQVSFRAAPESSVSQLSLYNAYRTRFDPYSKASPLMSGQELIQLACATFPGCAMAKDDDDYVLKGLDKKEAEAEAIDQPSVAQTNPSVRQDLGTESNQAAHMPPAAQAPSSSSEQMVDSDEMWERGLEGLVEPLRASSWLLSTYQNPPNPSSSTTQTELYSTYATRFSVLPSSMEPEPASASATDRADPSTELDIPGLEALSQQLNQDKSLTGAGHAEDIGIESTSSAAPPRSASVLAQKRENRLLSPIELIHLTRMTFPRCTPAVDENGRFVIKGLERREGVEKGREGIRVGDMYPFALVNAPDPSDPSHPFTSLLKRKLAMMHPEPNSGSANPAGASAPPAPHRRKKVKLDDLEEGDRELVEGLKRFKGSQLGQAVQDVCVTQ